MRALLLAGLIAAAPPAMAQMPVAPAASADAELWQLDQLRIARSSPESVLKAIEGDHSIEAVMKTLTRLGVTFTREHPQLVPDRLPPELRDTILKLPDGEPFVLPEPDFFSISVIVARKLPPGSASLHLRSADRQDA